MRLHRALRWRGATVGMLEFLGLLWLLIHTACWSQAILQAAVRVFGLPMFWRQPRCCGDRTMSLHIELGLATDTSERSVSPELNHLLSLLEPATSKNLNIRLKFAFQCVGRVAHLLEDQEVIACFMRLKAVAEGERSDHELAELAAQAARLANRHQGSRSLDGVGHAAVSASYACAQAAAVRPRQAAEYAAYAAVYGQGGYGATSDPESFAPEYEWQTAQLRALLKAARLAPSEA